jgi:hypothetical protein
MQTKGQAFRPGSRRPHRVKSSETPAVLNWAQRQGEETNRLSVTTTTGPGLCLTTNDSRERRTLRSRILRGLTIDHLKVESEPFWFATSSAMISNPVSVGSGGCSPRDEAPLRTLASAGRSAMHRGASRRDPTRPLDLDTSRPPRKRAAMVYIGTNTPTGAGARSLSANRDAESLADTPPSEQRDACLIIDT